MKKENAVKPGIEMPAYLDLWLLWQILQRLAPVYTLDGGIYLTAPFSLFLDAYKLAIPAMGAMYSPKPELHHRQLGNERCAGVRAGAGLPHDHRNVRGVRGRRESV